MNHYNYVFTMKGVDGDGYTSFWYRVAAWELFDAIDFVKGEDDVWRMPE